MRIVGSFIGMMGQVCLGEGCLGDGRKQVRNLSIHPDVVENTQRSGSKA
jgi:hypothetical protein